MQRFEHVVRDRAELERIRTQREWHVAPSSRTLIKPVFRPS
jgi:hypothetical protein